MHQFSINVKKKCPELVEGGLNLSCQVYIGHQDEGNGTRGCPD